MVAFAVIVYLQTKSFEAIIPFFFGVLGTYGVYRNILKYIHEQTETMYWLKNISVICALFILLLLQHLL